VSGKTSTDGGCSSPTSASRASDLSWSRFGSTVKYTPPSGGSSATDTSRPPARSTVWDRRNGALRRCRTRRRRVVVEQPLPGAERGQRDRGALGVPERPRPGHQQLGGQHRVVSCNAVAVERREREHLVAGRDAGDVGSDPRPLQRARRTGSPAGGRPALSVRRRVIAAACTRTSASTGPGRGRSSSSTASCSQSPGARSRTTRITPPSSRATPGQGAAARPSPASAARRDVGSRADEQRHPQSADQCARAGRDHLPAPPQSRS
jgi:hypothetical protein